MQQKRMDETEGYILPYLEKIITQNIPGNKWVNCQCEERLSEIGSTLRLAGMAFSGMLR
jgi:hypothetical protein